MNTISASARAAAVLAIVSYASIAEVRPEQCFLGCTDAVPARGAAVPEGGIAGIRIPPPDLDIGYIDLVSRLGAAVPDGTGVVFGQVEANVDGPGSYAPLTSDPEFAGKKFTLMSGPSAPSGHADLIGYEVYGLFTSIAPGIVDIFNYEAGHWIGSGYLLSGSDELEPLLPPAGLKIFNNSWGGASSSSSLTNKRLRRADFAVMRDNILMINAVNNLLSPPQPPPPPLMSMMYNGLAVGDRYGLHDSSDVISGIDGPGRQKPEIVAPGFTTSVATARTSAVAALLVETARTDAAVKRNPSAQRTEALKAIMLAGAKKEDVHGAAWTNNPALSGPTRGVTVTPIDDIVGAGTVNVNTAHFILTAGEQDGASSVPDATNIAFVGWDLATVGIGESRYYRFHLNDDAEAVTFAATWHRRSTAPLFITSFPGNFNLYLWRIGKGKTLTPLVGDPGLRYFSAGNVTSESTKDNIEYIHGNGLEPGNYVLELRRIDALALQPTYDVGVAWVMPERNCVPVDLDEDGFINGFDLALLLSDWGVCPSSEDGPCPADLNCDGIVSGLDLAILLGSWG